MKELQDYSGEYKPDTKFEDFSKEALIRLLKSYQVSFVGLMGMWHTVNMQRMTAEEASDVDAAVYARMVRKFALPMVTQALNIKGDDVVTMLKYFQFSPDGAREGLYQFDCEVKSRNHAILTFTRCPTLFWVEKKGTERDINCLCGPGGVEDRAFVEICKFFSPRIKSRALKLPPRKGPDDICCVWEFKAEP